MPHSNWKGSISFGLVNIPIVLFNSQDPSGGVSFKQINIKTGDKIKYKRVDAETDQEVPWEQIGKGYEYEKGVVLPVEEGELKRVAGENAHSITIEEFIDKKNINLVNVDKTYYLVPEKKREKGYVILREALNSSSKVGIAKVIISTKEYLAAVSTFEQALVLHLLHYQDEIRPLSEFHIPTDDLSKYKVTAKEITIAKQLIKSMSAKWKPQKYKDEYKEAVKKWVEEKLNHLPESQMAQRASKQKLSGKGVNFIDLLRKSLASTKPQSKTANKKKMGKSKTIPHKQTAHRKSVTYN